MNARARVADHEFAPLLQRQAHASLLRFIACGSVDHGKSTLLGRLLYETKQLLEDQLDALESDSCKFGTQGDELDFSLLLDGLAAEREQKITIDVAYRFFATARRGSSSSTRRAISNTPPTWRSVHRSPMSRSSWSAPTKG